MKSKLRFAAVLFCLFGMVWIFLFPFIVEQHIGNYAGLLCNPGEGLEARIYRSTMRSSYSLYCLGSDYRYDAILRQMLIFGVLLIGFLVAVNVPVLPSRYPSLRKAKPKNDDYEADQAKNEDMPLTSKLADLEQAFTNGLLTQDEYERKRREIVDNFN